MKVYLLYQRKPTSPELENTFVVAEVSMSVIPPPKSMLAVVLYEDAGEEKMGEFRVVSDARYYLINTRKILPHLALPSIGLRDDEASLFVEPADEVAQQWVEGVIKQTVAEGEAFLETVEHWQS
jgi:hypothetical protein